MLMRTIGVLLVGVAYVGVLGEAHGAPAASERPNFVFILADDWGWGDLGCFGHQQLRTPQLDRLSRQGLRFTQFYVCSAVCSPSRTAFMTGSFPARHRIHGHLATHEQNEARGMPNFLDPSVPTVSRYLKEAGYATAHFGKWHLGHGEGAPEPSAYGFDDYRCVNANGPGWDESDPYLRAKSTDLIVDETIRFIEQHKEGPFYVQAWLLLTHATLHPTEEQLAAYKGRFNPGRVPYEGAQTIYYASATAADAAIGRLIQRLDDLGLAENTVVMFSSDNGPEDIGIRNASHSGVGSPGPLRGRKRSLYEGGIRVPFIVRWPGHAPAGKVDQTTVVAGVDFLPTVCSIAGAKLPEGIALDGEDMSAALSGRPIVRRNPLMWEWRFNIFGHVFNKSPMLAIREGPWKLLMNPDRRRMELYDIPRDPREMVNVAKENPEVVNKLAHDVVEWAARLPPGPKDPDAGSNDYPWPRDNR